MSAIENHSEYPLLLSLVQYWAEQSRSALMDKLYDRSGESFTWEELRRLPQGRLVAMVVDQVITEEQHLLE